MHLHLKEFFLGGNGGSSRLLYHRYMLMCLFRLAAVVFYVLAMTDVSIYLSCFFRSFFPRMGFECLSAPLAVGTGRVSSSDYFFFFLRVLIRNPTGFIFFPPVIILGASIIFSLRNSLFSSE